MNHVKWLTFELQFSSNIINFVKYLIINENFNKYLNRLQNPGHILNLYKIIGPKFTVIFTVKNLR